MGGRWGSVWVSHSARLEGLLLSFFLLLFRSFVFLVDADPVEFKCKGRASNLVVEFLKDPTDIRVVRFLVEFERTDVGQEGLEHFGHIFA